SDFDLHVGADHAYAVTSDVLRCRSLDDRAGRYVEDRTVPGARHLVAVNSAVRQRPTPMSAGVVQGVISAPDVEQREALPLDLDELGLSRCEVTHRGYPD